MTNEPAWSPPGPPAESVAGGEPPTVRPAAPEATWPTTATPAPGYVAPGNLPAEYGAGYASPGYASPGYASPAYAAPGYAAPGYATPGYATPGATAAGYGATGYGYPYAGYAYPLTKRTNPMAIASMTMAIVGLPLIMCYGVGLPISVVGAILGHVAKRQIKERGEGGDGMALAGIIMGWVGTGLAALYIIALVGLITVMFRSAPAG